MASNDSGAAVAATVNAVTPILPPSQAENKGQEATQANHNAAPSTTTTEAKAALPALSDPSPVTAKEVPKNDSSSVPASSNTSTSSIPSSKATETNASSSASSQPVDTASSESQSKPTEDKASAADSTTAKPATDTATSKTSNLSENKKEENNKKENKESETIPEQEEKKTDQKTPTPSADGDKAKTDKTEQKATNESPSPNTNIDNKISAEKPSVSGSEAGKSDNTQDATSTATVESPQAEIASAKTKPPVPTPVVSKPVATIKPMVESPAASEDSATPMDTSTSKSNTTSSNAKSNNKRPAEDGDDTSSDKKIKSSSSASSSSGGQKEGNKSAKEVFEYMDKTFEQRRKIITKQMPTIPELKSMYPELFMCKQLLLEFQRITKIDIDQKIQEFCVRYATAVIEMARSNKAAAPVLARWEKAKQENETLKQYWDMVTALCLLPLHFGENFVEMVLEIEEDEEVKAQGKIVPTLVARGNIFRTDEFFLIAENTIVQEFEEFTIAFASLYSSYWVFNMVYPETIENTYNYIQRCIVRQREPGAISAVCKNFTKSLQKWNKEKEGK